MLFQSKNEAVLSISERIIAKKILCRPTMVGDIF